MWHNPHPLILCCCRVALNLLQRRKKTNPRTYKRTKWLERQRREEKSVSLVRLYLCIQSHQRNVKHDVLNKQFLPFCALLCCTIFRTVHVTSNRNACNTQNPTRKKENHRHENTQGLFCVCRRVRADRINVSFRNLPRQKRKNIKDI